MKKAIRKGTKKPKITKDSKGKRAPLCSFIYSDRALCVGSERQSLLSSYTYRYSVGARTKVAVHRFAVNYAANCSAICWIGEGCPQEQGAEGRRGEERQCPLLGELHGEL